MTKENHRYSARHTSVQNQMDSQAERATAMIKNAKPLSPYYYHENFNELIAFVADNYWELLDCREKNFYNLYQSMGESAQQLYCRLLMRKRDYFRVSKTNYPEIDAVADALTELINHSFCIAAGHDDAQCWIELFHREEIRRALPTTAATPRSHLNSNSDETHSSLLQKDLLGYTPIDLLLQTDTVYGVSHKDVFINFQLLFFGDLHQDISAFVLRDLGITRYESTLHCGQALPFSSRAQLLAHRHFYACAEMYDDATKSAPDALLDLYHLLHTIPTEIVSTDRPLKRRLEKWSNRIARQLERLGAIEDATAIYQSTPRPPARERLARIYKKHNRSEAAFAICKEIVENPYDAAELDFAEQYAQPLAKTLNAECRIVNKYSPPLVPLTLRPSTLSVEFSAALHYAKTGKCFYVENNLITGVFGLAMWDIIFAPIKGAFYHPFQTAPADFRETDFTNSRKDQFDSRLLQINQSGLAPFVLPNLHQKHGMSNPLVNWHAINRQLLTLAIEIIPVAHWTCIFEHLLGDISAHRSGLPDLIYFANTGGYELIEVKGPGDQLQKNQRRWMKFFAANNIPHSVAHIKYSDIELLTAETLEANILTAEQHQPMHKKQAITQLHL